MRSDDWSLSSAAETGLACIVSMTIWSGYEKRCAMRNCVAYSVKPEDGPQKIELPKMCYVREVANNKTYKIDKHDKQS